MERTLLILMTQDILMIVGLLGLMISLVDEIYNAEKISILLNFSVIWYQNITFFITKPI